MEPAENSTAPKVALFHQRRKTEAQVEPKVKRAAAKAAEVAVRQAFKLLQDEEWYEFSEPE